VNVSGRKGGKYAHKGSHVLDSGFSVFQNNVGDSAVDSGHGKAMEVSNSHPAT